MTTLSFEGLGVVVVGLAREGNAVAQFLAKYGAKVSVTDARPAEKLNQDLDALRALGITFYLGGHPESLLNPKFTQLLVVSPGVPLNIPFLRQAQKQGILLSTESRLFSQLCPVPIVGISGSSGKTTTTTLVGKMLEMDGFITHVGGNIGQPLINALPKIQADNRVVMELSSFQLEYFHAALNQSADAPRQLSPLKSGFSPSIAAILNVTPNHLDRHKTMAAYLQAKRALIDYLPADGIAVLGYDNPATRNLGMAMNSAQVKWFSAKNAVRNGAFLDKGYVTLVVNGENTPVCHVDEIQLRGDHNRLNFLAACAIAESAGASIKAMKAVATTFAGVPHRLEIVSRKNGITFVNDSIATSPERLIAGLKAFDTPVILLAGGKDKDLPWQDAAQLMAKRAKHVILFGAAADLIADALDKVSDKTRANWMHRCKTLDEAVSVAKKLAQIGDVVLLSPGGTSYDAYVDFAARGEHFKALVEKDDELSI